MHILNWLDSLKNLLKTPQCAQCANAVESQSAKFCPACRLTLGQRPNNPLLIKDNLTLFAASDLKPAFKRQLYGYKYHGTQNASWLTDFWIDYWQQLSNDTHPENLLVITIPPHEDSKDYKRLTRLAEPFARFFGYAFSDRALQWHRACSPQHHLLTRRQRFENISGAFSVDASLLRNVQRVIILDDVTTTGATLLSAGHAVNQAVEGKVSVTALALSSIPFQIGMKDFARTQPQALQLLH